MGDKTIFICQASADIAHILKEIDTLQANDTEYKFKILCVDPVLYDCFQLIKNVPAEIKYVPRIIPKLSRLWTLWSWRNKVKTLLAFEGFCDPDTTVYFTSVCDDPVSAYYVSFALKNGAKVKYLNHYDNIQAITPSKNATLRERFRLYLNNIFTGASFSIYNMAGRWNVLRFNYERYNIQELHPVLDPAICAKYAYVPDTDGKRSVLFFSQPSREANLITEDEYNQIHKTMVDYLHQKGYYVVGKGHPRLGVCPSNKGQFDFEIPTVLPSELVKTDAFDCCYAFMTIALGSAAKLGVESYSFLPLMKDHESEAYKKAIKFTENSGEGKIKYFELIQMEM